MAQWLLVLFLSVCQWQPSAWGSLSFCKILGGMSFLQGPAVGFTKAEPACSSGTCRSAIAEEVEAELGRGVCAGGGGWQLRVLCTGKELLGAHQQAEPVPQNAEA